MERKGLFCVVVGAVWCVMALPMMLYGGEAGERERIAVLDFAPSNVPEGIAASVTDMLSTELVNTRLFEVIERMQVKKILNEQGLQKTGITESETAVEIGKMLNIKRVVIGNVGKLGQSLVVTMKLVSVEKANILIAEKEVAKNEDDLVRVCEVLVTKLVKALGAAAPAPAAVSTAPAAPAAPSAQPVREPVKAQPTAPSAPAKAAERRDTGMRTAAPSKPMSPLAIGGWASLGAGAVLVVLGGVGHWQMVEAKDDYEKTGSAAAKDDYTLWKGVAIAGYAVGGAGIAVGVTLLVLDQVWGAEKDAPRVTAAPMPGGFVVSVAGRW